MEKTTIYVFRTQAKFMTAPEPEPLECDQLQCNYLEYPLHRNELWRFLSLFNFNQALLRAFVKHPLQFI